MSKNKRTQNQMRQKDKYSDKPRNYKQNGRFVEFGSTGDLVARLERHYYEYLSGIFAFASWDGENWVKPNLSKFQNPIEQLYKELLEENLQIRDELISRKLIFQSEDFYWTKALEYQEHLNNGGKDLSLPNSNIYKVEWLEKKEEEASK